MIGAAMPKFRKYRMSWMRPIISKALVDGYAFLNQAEPCCYLAFFTYSVSTLITIPLLGRSCVP